MVTLPLPFDETGQLASNLVHETQTLQSVNGVQHQFIVPDFAPFFKTGFSIYHVEGTRFLTEGTDFFFSHWFEDADSNLADKVYSSVTLMDTTFTGTLKLQFQSLGGDFVTALTAAIENGFDTLLNLQSVRWEDIVTPPTFPPTSHTHVVTDIEGVNRVIEEMTKIRQSIDAHFTELTMSDITDLETVYVAPLMTNLQALTSSIIANGMPQSTLVYTAELFTDDDTGSDDIDMGVVTVDTWTDTPIVMNVVKGGTYLLRHDMLPVAVGDAITSIDYRWRVNSLDVTWGRTNGRKVPLAANSQVRLQVRVKATSVTNFFLASSEAASIATATYVAA